MSVPSTYHIHSALPSPTSNDPSLFTGQFGRTEPTLREYAHVLRKHWRIVILPCLAALTLTAVVLLIMTPTYTATSTILIERQIPQVLDVKQPGSEEADLEHDFYETQYQLLASRSLAARVIGELGLRTHPLFQTPTSHPVAVALSHSEAAVQHNHSNDVAQDADPDLGVNPDVIDIYLKRLRITPTPRTRLVAIAFDSPDPLLSARIVRAHIRAYITKGTELRSEASTNAQQFLRTKLNELKTRVEQSEAALNSYRRDRGIVGSATDDKTRVVIGRIIDLSKALTAAETQRIALDAEEHLTRTRDYNSLPEVQNSRVIQLLKGEQSNVDSEYMSLASQYKRDYPPLAELAAKRRSLEVRLNEEMRRVAASVEWRYAAASAREQELRQDIDAEKQQAATLNQASLQDAILAREVDSNRELYKSVLARMSEMGMAAGISASNVSIVDPAEVPLLPSSPKTTLILSLAGLLSLFCGISGAFLLDRFDGSFDNSEELEYVLGLPSLGSVPNFQKLSRTIHHGMLRYWPSRLPVSLEHPSADGELAKGICSFAAAAEAYRAIRISILLSKAEAPPKTILITSAGPREGKTVTAINLGIAFAKMGSKVLLIDGDLRRSRCHEILGLGHRPGLTEVLTGSGSAEELVAPTGVDRLSCLTAGSRPPNPGELLGSAKMAYTILCLRNSYDFIILDSAPVMPVTDTLPLTAVVDGVLLVVGPHTPKDHVRRASTRLSQIRTNVLGAILNQTEVSNNDYYYSRSSLEYIEKAGETDARG